MNVTYISNLTGRRHQIETQNHDGVFVPVDDGYLLAETDERKSLVFYGDVARPYEAGFVVLHRVLMACDLRKYIGRVWPTLEAAREELVKFYREPTAPDPP